MEAIDLPLEAMFAQLAHTELERLGLAADLEIHFVPLGIEVHHSEHGSKIELLGASALFMFLKNSSQLKECSAGKFLTLAQLSSQFNQLQPHL